MHKNNLLEEDYPIKGYFHFDYPIHISKVASYVQNQKMIAEHSFFPLIAYEQKIEKFTEDPKNFEDGRPYKKDSRPIKYAGHLDGYIYKYYANELNRAYNNWASRNGINDNSTAYRTNKKGKSNIDFAAEVISYISNHDEAFILVDDFKSYFNSFDHQLLKKRIYEALSVDHLPKDWFNVFKSVTKYGFVEKKIAEDYFGDEGFLRHQGHKKFISKNKLFSDFREFNKIESNNDMGRGVPQGVPISAVMSNVYTIKFDQEIKAVVEKNNGIYRRYSDDFIIVIPKSISGVEYTEKQFKDIVQIIHREATKNKLVIAREKTELYKKVNDKIYIFAEEPLQNKSYIDYLGFVYDGSRVTIRQRSIERFYRRMKKTVRTMEGKRRRNNKKIHKSKMKKLPHRNRIYGLFTDR